MVLYMQFMLLVRIIHCLFFHPTPQRVARGDHIAEPWYDYGVFCLLDSDMDRAEQCLKEAVALDHTLLPA